jgi:HEAT repeat protein
VVLALLCGILSCAPLAVGGAAGRAADDPGDVYAEEVAHLLAEARSPVPELRASAADGLYWLRCLPAEPTVVELLADAEPEVRRTAAFALSRLGGPAAVPALIARLRDDDAGVRNQARLALESLTQRPADDVAAWWAATDADGVERELLARLDDTTPGARLGALRALRCFAGPATEAPLLAFVARADGTEQRLAIEILERVGTEASLPWLCSVAEIHPTAAWALGAIGGPEAEQSLLRGLGRFGTYDPQHVINLDRLHSRGCGPYAPMLIEAYGCVTFRGQPENLAYDPTPLQRACTNSILRSGRGTEVICCVLDEMEGVASAGPIPADLLPAMVALRDELKPGFVRNDGVTTSQPMCAMSHLVRDRRLAPRLVPLLRHPAYVARVYAAMALGRLHAVEALPELLDVIGEGYPFDDAVTAVSGKHFGDSQTVRWRGFLCMAMGRMGGEDARMALERLATDAGGFRDIRYGAVVGLRFIGSEQSLPALRRVQQDDIIWRIRIEAGEAIREIELAADAGSPDLASRHGLTPWQSGA